MRIVKQRLIEMLPDVEIFLECVPRIELLPHASIALDGPRFLLYINSVDDLKFGRGAEYIDCSQAVLAFCTTGYFKSQNCMRELLRAAVTKKPAITMLESEKHHGGMLLEDVDVMLSELDTSCEKNGRRFASMYELWGLTNEVKEWQYAMPHAAELRDYLRAEQPIEWTRIGAFQEYACR